MADGDLVALNERVVRYARPSDVQNGILDGSAFVRPDKDRDGLSVTRIGVFALDPTQDLAAIRAVLGARMNLKKNGRLAEIGVADIVEVGRLVQQVLRVTEAPDPAEDGMPANPAHALVEGLPFAGAEQGSMNGLFASDLLALRVTAVCLHAAVEPSAGALSATA